MNQKWDKRFLELAQHIAGWSRDPSTRVGAVLVNDQRRIISVGFNGLPQGVEDTAERYENRDLKLKMIVHAEMNAMAFANCDLRGHTLYTWPFMPCSRCASIVIQHGIRRVVAPQASVELQKRWADDIFLAQMMFEEAGVELDLYDSVVPSRKEEILTVGEAAALKSVHPTSVLRAIERGALDADSRRCGNKTFHLIQPEDLAKWNPEHRGRKRSAVLNYE